MEEFPTEDLIFGPLLLLWGLAVAYGLASRHSWRIKKLLNLQKDASRPTETDLSQAPLFTVAYASESWFRRRWKLYPSEGAGELVIQSDEWSFSGFLDPREPMRLSFMRNRAGVRYEGMTWWPSGPVYWLSIDDGSSRHYFAAVAESMATPSKKKNSKLIQLLKREQHRSDPPPQN